MLRWLSVIYLALVLPATACDGKNPKAPAPGQMGPQKTLQEAWQGMQSAVADKDANELWGALSSESRHWLATGAAASKIDSLRNRSDEQLRPLAEQAHTTPDLLRKMSVPELARVVTLAEARKECEPVLNGRWASVEEGRESAVAHVECPDGKTAQLVFVREDGTWKLDVQATKQLHDAPSREQKSP